MSTLKNSRREKFANLLASGKTATDAYEEAGYKLSHSNGPALAKAARSSTRLLYGTNLCGDVTGKGTSGSNCEAESIEAPSGGGPLRSSVEAG